MTLWKNCLLSAVDNLAYAISSRQLVSLLCPKLYIIFALIKENKSALVCFKDKNAFRAFRDIIELFLLKQLI